MSVVGKGLGYLGPMSGGGGAYHVTYPLMRLILPNLPPPWTDRRLWKHYPPLTSISQLLTNPDKMESKLLSEWWTFHIWARMHARTHAHTHARTHTEREDKKWNIIKRNTRHNSYFAWTLKPLCIREKRLRHFLAWFLIETKLLQPPLPQRLPSPRGGPIYGQVCQLSPRPAPRGPC